MQPQDNASQKQGRGDESAVALCRRLSGQPQWQSVPILILAKDVGAVGIGDLLEAPLTRYVERGAAAETIRQAVVDLLAAASGAHAESRSPSGAPQLQQHLGGLGWP